MVGDNHKSLQCSEAASNDFTVCFMDDGVHRHVERVMELEYALRIFKNGDGMVEVYQ